MRSADAPGMSSWCRAAGRSPTRCAQRSPAWASMIAPPITWRSAPWSNMDARWSGLGDGFTLAGSAAAIHRALHDGRVPVWAPARMALCAKDIPGSWDVTSDSLAAWLAGKIGAARVLLVKHVEASGPLGLHDLVARGIVDPLFPRLPARPPAPKPPSPVRTITRPRPPPSARANRPAPGSPCNSATRVRKISVHGQGQDTTLGLGAHRIGTFLQGMPGDDPRARRGRSVRQQGGGRGRAHVQAGFSAAQVGARVPRRRPPARRRSATSTTASTTRWCSRPRPRTRSRSACSASPTPWRPTCSRRPESAASRRSCSPATPRRSSRPRRRRAWSRCFRAVSTSRTPSGSKAFEATDVVETLAGARAGARTAQARACADARAPPVPDRPPGPPAAGEGAGGLRQTELRMVGVRRRREGRGADDRGDHRAPPAAPGEGRPRGAAGPLPRRSGAPLRRVRRAVRARPGGAEGPAGLFRQARAQPRPLAPRHAHLRRDRRRLGADGRCHPGARHRDARSRGRRDRPRLPARHAVSASGRCGARAQGGRPAGQRRLRHRRTSCGAARRAGADFLLSLTEHTLDIAADTGATPVLIPAEHGDLPSLWRAAEAAEQARHRGDPRSDPRPDPFRLHGLAAALRRGAPPAAGRRDPHGHRQPHRADRCRLRRRHGGAARHLLGARASATSWSCR